LTLSEEELEILEEGIPESAEPEDGPVVTAPGPAGGARSGAAPGAGSGAGPGAASPRETQDLTPEELEILDESDLAFMEVLESSEARENQQPTKPPELKRNAPLETLQLRDVMPGRERHPSQPDLGGEMYEVPFEDSKAGKLPEYEKRITPSRAMPDMTPPGLFRSLGIDATRSLVTRMNFLATEPGEVIIRQGEVGGSLYVIVRGEVRIVKEQGETRTEVSRLGETEFFGEMALVTDTPRVATVEAVTEVELLEVTRETMRLLIQDFPQVVPNVIKFLKDRLLEIFVKTSELLAPVPERYRWQLARKFKLYEIPEGRTILREGKPSGGLFIFLAGQGVATRKRRGKVLKLADLGPGSLVGEISLVTGGPAVASVTATTKCWLLAVSAKQFEVLTRNFPELKQLIERIADQRRRENARLLAGDPNYISQEFRLV
jgi:CRP-like cAMP-binding protein